jgi:hypothetical protein
LGEELGYFSNALTISKMGLFANSAFSRSMIIRLSEAYTSRSYPFAMELIEEKVIAGIRSSSQLRFDGIRLTLDQVVHRDLEIKIHASHILGYGLTARLLKKGEYETEAQIIICDKKLERLPNLEKEFLSEIKDSLFAAV